MIAPSSRFLASILVADCELKRSRGIGYVVGKREQIKMCKDV